VCKLDVSRERASVNSIRVNSEDSQEATEGGRVEKRRLGLAAV